MAETETLEGKDNKGCRITESLAITRTAKKQRLGRLTGKRSRGHAAVNFMVLLSTEWDTISQTQ